MKPVLSFANTGLKDAGMFFAGRVLLVEGPSETALINKLLDDGKLKLPDGIYVLDCLGKYNIHRFMNLLGNLGISHSVLHDDDENKNEHHELNQLIADSKQDGSTVAIKQLPKDLESVLGVSPPGSSHRKPQHLLYCYATGPLCSVVMLMEFLMTCLAWRSSIKPPTGKPRQSAGSTCRLTTADWSDRRSQAKRILWTSRVLFFIVSANILL